MSEHPSGIGPLINRVLIKPDEVEETTSGGIIIPEPVTEQHQVAQAIGTLVAIGPDTYIQGRWTTSRLINGEMKVVESQVEHYSDENRLQVGDRVIFAKFGGIPIQGADGVEYRLMRDVDITAKATKGVTYTGIESRKPVSIV